MNTFIRLILSACMISLCLSHISAQERYTVSGKVTDSKGKLLPYASISTKDVQFGTLSMQDGSFQLKLPAGKHILEVKYIGYVSYKDTIDVNKDIKRNYQLEAEDLFVDEVWITPDGKDPAYTIIRQAIKNKKQNRVPFPYYNYKAYTKTVIRFPKDFDISNLERLASLTGNDQELEDIPDLKSKILFLSETVSKIDMYAPDQLRETILSSRISGNRENSSIFGNLFTYFNPYDNRLVMEGISDRGIISPIADNAFFYYRYKYLGTTRSKGFTAYKIKVTPKRKQDPVYRGVIYIAAESFAVKSLDLYASTQNIELLDTLRLQQDYMSFQDKLVPFKSRFDAFAKFNVLFMTIPIKGFSTSVLSNYKVPNQTASAPPPKKKRPRRPVKAKVPRFIEKIDTLSAEEKARLAEELRKKKEAEALARKKKRFDREILAISDSALEQPITFWEEVRPIPLEVEEIGDYQLRDSLEEVRTSPAYLDSLTKANRSLSFSDVILTGITFKNFRKKHETRIAPLLETFGFNPMEGFFLNPHAEFRKELSKERSISIEPEIRYGFSNKRFSYKAKLRWETNARYNGLWELAGGNYPSQFSSFKQIDNWGEAYNSLVRKRNLMRMYRRQFATIAAGRDIANGLRIAARVRYENRHNMLNTTEFSIWQKDEMYTPNIPVANHQAFIVTARLQYRPFNRYITIPNERFNMGSKWPLFSIKYTKAFPQFFERGADFDQISGSISNENRLGILGTLQWEVTAGGFLNTNALFFPDYYHFKGNQTRLHTGNFDVFYLMPYYEFSTADPFLEFHAEHSFDGFLLNKIPLVRTWKLHEYVGIHGLFIDGMSKPYLELNIGVEKNLLKILPIRIDINFRIMGESTGARLGYMFITPPVDF